MLVYALKYTTVPPRQESLVILGPRGVVRLVKRSPRDTGRGCSTRASRSASSMCRPASRSRSTPM